MQNSINNIELEVDSLSDIPKNGQIPLQVNFGLSKNKLYGLLLGLLLVFFQQNNGFEIILKIILKLFDETDIETDSPEDHLIENIRKAKKNFLKEKERQYEDAKENYSKKR